MARRLGGENILILTDNISDSKIELKYRMPTTKEIVSYRNGSTKRVKNTLVNCTGENRLKHGLKVLTGIGEGSFEKQAGSGWVPVSSDANSKYYDPEWKKLVSELAPDLVELLAVHVFDASTQVAGSGNEEDGENNGKEDGAQGKTGDLPD